MSRLRSPTLAALLPAALALLAACSSIKVTQDYSKATDFSAYRTFAMISAADQDRIYGASTVPPETARRVEDALTQELTARGLRPAGAGQPDLTVAYHGGRRMTTDGKGYGRTYEYSGTDAKAVEITKDVQEGWLLVDLLDARSGQLVWRGEGEAMKPGKNAIEYGVQAILAQYPPSAK
jgi:hypothetical protein